jgi:tetratricopeptide (TPR) repeat protein
MMAHSHELDGVRPGPAWRACMVLASATCLLVAVPGAVAQRPVGGAPIGGTFGLAQLPAYCADAQSFAKSYDANYYTPAQKHWISLMGSAFHHIHHYCWALQQALWARNPDIGKEQRISIYGSALANCSYVVERVPPDFVLLPEIYLRMGQFTFESGDVANALEYFDKSRQAKADYWPAYVEIAKANMSIGRLQHAEAVLQAGLEVMPDNANLKQALDELKLTSAGTKRHGLN